MTSVPIILASSSPRRKELLAGIGLQFTIDPSTIDESFEAGTAPEEVVEMLALKKAGSVAAKYDHGLVIGSDTIVVLDNAILGKPIDNEDAYSMLMRLQGKVHTVYSGLAIVDASTNQSRVSTSNISVKIEQSHNNIIYFGDTGQYRIVSDSRNDSPEIIVGHMFSKVTFRPMCEKEIWAYIQTGEPLDKAGSYGIQGIGAVFIEKIEGDFYNVMGIPLNLLYQFLNRFGVSPFEARTN